MSTEVLTGKVKFYVIQTGYGFIVNDAGGDVFFHHTGLTEGTKVMKDDKVQFEIEEGKKGKKAVNIVKL